MSVWAARRSNYNILYLRGPKASERHGTTFMHSHQLASLCALYKHKNQFHCVFARLCPSPAARANLLCQGHLKKKIEKNPGVDWWNMAETLKCLFESRCKPIVMLRMPKLFIRRRFNRSRWWSKAVCCPLWFWAQFIDPSCWLFFLRALICGESAAAAKRILTRRQTGAFIFGSTAAIALYHKHASPLGLLLFRNTLCPLLPFQTLKRKSRRAWWSRAIDPAVIHTLTAKGARSGFLSWQQKLHAIYLASSAGLDHWF